MVQAMRAQHAAELAALHAELEAQRREIAHLRHAAPLRLPPIGAASPPRGGSPNRNTTTNALAVGGRGPTFVPPLVPINLPNDGSPGRRASKVRELKY